MSRIGKQQIALPTGVVVAQNGPVISVKGPKGSLDLNCHGRVNLSQTSGFATVGLVDGEESKYWGLYRTLVANMVVGVSTGFSRSLELVGTGYRAQMNGKQLGLTVGYSHPVVIDPGSSLAFEVDKAGKVTISGPSKELVGQMAAKIRAIRPPEPYHGKGIRYAGEVITVKAGKSSGKK
jgi:large subunit ribosomal protein L6